jgi:homoaconitase
VLPLWLANKEDYALIGSGDRMETVGLADLMAGKSDAAVRLNVTKRVTGEVKVIETRHTMSEDQLRWLKAGSALNHIRSQRAKSARWSL